LKQHKIVSSASRPQTVAPISRRMGADCFFVVFFRPREAVDFLLFAEAM